MKRLAVFVSLAVSALYALSTPAAVYPTKLYLQDGLVAHWDGLDNAGSGTNEPAATVWKDLIGTRNLALRSGCAVFTNGNALACLATSGYSAGPAAACTTYKTIEFVGTPQPAGYKTQAFPFCSGTGSRAIIFETGFSGTMSSTSYRIWSNKPTTLAVTYDGDATSNYYDHATLLTKTGSYDSWGASNEGLCIGERHATASSPYRGQVFAVRLYDRVLSEKELALNAAWDDIRFFGADPETVIAGLELPDGYRWNATDKSIEVRVRAVASFGTVADPEVWVKPGESVSFTFTPTVAKTKCFWSACPKDAVYSNDGRTVTFSTYSTRNVSVDGCWDQSFSAHSYLQHGLMVQFDGIDNAGSGTNEPAATAWKDLVGTRDLALTQWGSFRDGKALYCGNTGNAYSAGPADAYTTYNTIELSCELGPWMKYVFCAGDNSHNRLFAVYYNDFLVKTGEGYWSTSGGHPTMSATYSGATPTGHYANGEASVRKGSDTWGGKGSKMVVGAGYNGGSAFNGNVYLIRLYDRALSQDELRFNAAIDCVRFDGAQPRDTTLATATLPAGYVWDANVRALRACVAAEVPSGTASATGLVTATVLGGATSPAMAAQAIVGEKVAVDCTVPAAATTRRFVGLPSNATLAETPTGLCTDFSVQVPTYLALDAYDARSADELSVPLSGEAAVVNTRTVKSLCLMKGVHVGAVSSTGMPSAFIGEAKLVVEGLAEISAAGRAYAFLKPNGGGRLNKCEIVLGDGAVLKLLRDIRIEDVLLIGSAKIDLNGHVLTVSSLRHKDCAGWDPSGEIVDAVGIGRIEWSVPSGTLLRLR